MAELDPIQCVIIVCGKALVQRDDTLVMLTELKGRLARAAGIFHRKAAQFTANRLRIIVTGYGLQQGMTEAEAMRQHLIFNCFIPPECILVEDRSRTTTANIWNAYFMVQHLCSQAQRAALGAPDCNPLDIADIVYQLQLKAPQHQLALAYLQSIYQSTIRFPRECVLVTSDVHIPRSQIMIQHIWQYLAAQFRAVLNVDSIQCTPSHHAAIFRHAGLHNYVHRPEIRSELVNLRDNQLLLSWINCRNDNHQHPIITTPEQIATYSARFTSAQHILDATIGPQSQLPWNEQDERVYQHASCGVCFDFSFVDGDLPVNMGSLWCLVYHWDRRFQTRWFDSRDNARAFMQQHPHLTRTQKPRASRMLLNPDGIVSAEHFASDEWKSRVYSEAQRVLRSMHAAYRAFHANPTLAVTRGKFNPATLPSSIQYPANSAAVFRPAARSPSAETVFEGGFTRYEGSTIIMTIVDEALPLWQRFHRLLISDNTVRAAMYILPPSSYHITLRGITEVHTIGGTVKYNRNVVHPKFSTFVLLDQQFQDTFGNRKLEFGPADGIFERYLSPHCHQFVFQSAHQQDETVLRELEQIIVNEFASEIDMGIAQQQWHMSIGYWHNNPKWTDAQRQEAGVLYQRAQIAIRTHYRKFIEGLSADERKIVLQFQRPRVCCYQSMIEFNYIPEF